MHRVLVLPVLRSLGLVPLALFTASTALASPGVVEINQTCAAQTGCFSGDAPGFPIEIDGSAGRSYRLTSDLIVPDTNTGGISIQAPGVSVDLSGFSVVGAACVDAVSDCRPESGSGSGIIALSSGDGVAIKNGSVVGMGATGVVTRSNALVDDLRVRWNRLDGINVGSNSVVTGCTSFQNGVHGIDGANAARIAGNVSTFNGGDGINVASGAVVVDNVARQNQDDGISASTGSLVRGNVMNGNQDFGLVANVFVSYRANSIVGNLTGTVSGSPVSRGDNFCNGTGTTSSFCP